MSKHVLTIVFLASFLLCCRDAVAQYARPATQVPQNQQAPVQTSDPGSARSYYYRSADDFMRLPSSSFCQGRSRDRQPVVETSPFLPQNTMQMRPPGPYQTYGQTNRQPVYQLPPHAIYPVYQTAPYGRPYYPPVVIIQSAPPPAAKPAEQQAAPASSESSQSQAGAQNATAAQPTGVKTLVNSVAGTLYSSTAANSLTRPLLQLLMSL